MCDLYLTNCMQGNPLEYLIIPQLIKKYPLFCGTRLFITVFTTAHHCSLW